MPGIVIPTRGDSRELPSAPNSLPSVRQTAVPTATQLGAGARLANDSVAAGMGSLARSLEAVGSAMQAREDADVLLRQQVALQDAAREAHADWASRKGVKAWGVTKEANHWWDKQVGDIQSDLNPRQQAAFAKIAERLRASSMDSVSQHEAVQSRKSLDDSAAAAVVSSINLAASNPTNADAVAGARQSIAEAVALRAGLNGWGPEQQVLLLQEGLTNLHKQVAYGLLDTPGGATAARQYLEAHSEELTVAERRKLNDDVAAVGRLEAAQEFADVNGPDSGRPLGEVLKDARAKFSGEDERVVVNEVRARFREHDEAVNQSRKEALDKALEEMGPTGTAARISPQTWRELGPDQRRTLISQDEARLDRMQARADRAANRRERELTRQEREATRQGASVVMQMIEDMAEPGRTHGWTLERVKNLRNDGAVTDAQAMQMIKAISADAGDPASLDMVRINRAVLPVAKAKKYNRADQGLLTTYVGERVLEEQAMKGRTLSSGEIKVLVDEAVSPQEIGAWTIPFTDYSLRTKQKPEFKLLEAERSRLAERNAAKVDQVPVDQTQGIAEGTRGTIDGRPAVFRNGQWYVKKG